MYTIIQVGIALSTRQIIELPEGAEILSVSTRHNEEGPFLDVLFDQSTQGVPGMEKRRLFCGHLGSAMFGFNPKYYRHIGSAEIGRMYWHFWEDVRTGEVSEADKAEANDG